MNVSDPVESYGKATVHTQTNTWIGRVDIYKEWVFLVDYQYTDPVEIWIPKEQVRLVQEGKSSINI